MYWESIKKISYVNALIFRYFMGHGNASLHYNYNFYIFIGIKLNIILELLLSYYYANIPIYNALQYVIDSRFWVKYLKRKGKKGDYSLVGLNRPMRSVRFLDYFPSRSRQLVKERRMNLKLANSNYVNYYW